MERPIRIRSLGMEAYEPVWQRMRAFTDERRDDTVDEVWLVEHPPVFTLGQAGRREHLLNPGDIPVVSCDRGGQVTYHGPGQLVLYPLLNLRRLDLGVRDFVHLLEEALIRTLADFAIEAQRKDKAPGVYVGADKIASLGLRVRRACTFHGLSLNVAMDPEPFQRINPCGYAGLRVVQMRDFNGARKASVETVAPVLLRHLGALLACTPVYADLDQDNPFSLKAAEP